MYPPWTVGGGRAIPRQGGDDGEHGGVGQALPVKRHVGKQGTVEGREIEDGGDGFGAEGVPERAQPVPEIDAIVGGIAVDAAGNQPADAVVVVVEVAPAHEATGIGHKQEEQPVDEAEHVAVEAEGVGRLVAGGEQAVGKGEDGLFNTVAQAVAHPSTLVDPDPVPAFEDAGIGVGGGAGEARPMDDAVEAGKCIEAIATDDGVEVGFEIAWAHEGGRAAEDAEDGAVADDAPERIGAIEEFLEEDVGRPARGGRRVRPLQRLSRGDEMDGRRIGGGVGAMRDREDDRAGGGRRGIDEVVAKEAEERTARRASVVRSKASRTWNQEVRASR